MLSEQPEVAGIFTSVGRDNPQIYYNVTPREENPDVGSCSWCSSGTSQRFDTGNARPAARRFAEYPGARIELHEFENGPPIDAPIALRVSGPDLDTLRALAGEIERVFKQTRGTEYVYNPVRLPRTDLKLVIDREKAGLLGRADLRDRSHRAAGNRRTGRREVAGERRRRARRGGPRWPTPAGRPWSRWTGSTCREMAGRSRRCARSPISGSPRGPRGAAL